MRDLVNSDDAPEQGLGSEISSLFAENGLDFDIPELRGHEIEPASLEEGHAGDPEYRAL